MFKREANKTCTFDAWNRLVTADTVGNGSETYSYDADSRRPGLNFCGTTLTDSYYDTSWQDVEDDIVHGGTTTRNTFVWSPSYIDDVVARDQNGRLLMWSMPTIPDGRTEHALLPRLLCRNRA